MQMDSDAEESGGGPSSTIFSLEDLSVIIESLKHRVNDSASDAEDSSGGPSSTSARQRILLVGQ